MKRLWWISEDRQGSILAAEAEEITGAVRAEAFTFLLGQCADAEQEDGIRRGSFEVEEAPNAKT